MSAWGKLTQAGLLSGLALCAVAPHAYYLGAVAHTERLSARYPGLSVQEILQLDLLKLGVLIVISSLVGSFFSRRNKLPDLGAVRALPKAAWLLAPLASLIIYLTLGRALAERLPGQYPAALGWAAVVLVKGAVFDELVARYGMMTLFAGVTRSARGAIGLQAVFFTAIVFKDLGALGVSASWDGLFVGSLVCSFVTHLVYGAVYAKYGLIPSMVVHALVDLRFVAHALVS